MSESGVLVDDVSAAREELAARVEAVHVRAALVVAERDKLDDASAVLRQRLSAARDKTPRVARGRMARLARRLGIGDVEVAFLWAAVAVTLDPRVAVQVEALAGSAVRRGLSVAVFARFAEIDEVAARELAIRLSRCNPLVESGLLVGEDGGTAVTRCYAAPPQLLAYLAADDAADPLVRRVEVSDVSKLLFDPQQLAVLDELQRILACERVLVALEGPRASGRTTAIAAATGNRLAVLDAGRLSETQLIAGLVSLRREQVLCETLPVIADVDRLGGGERRRVAEFVAECSCSVVITSALPGLEIDVDRPVVRVRWSVPEAEQRRRLWEHIAGVRIAGDVDTLATRFRAGPGTITRAIESARIATSGPLDAAALTAGLRHNIGEELGGLAQRVEVTQRWDDLVLAPDTLDQVNTLIARVRHAYQVLDRWHYRDKIARGAGVPALFSGPPGTGKTMVAGLIARELELDLYQVDLSQIVSKWVGETEKQLARVFDAAEQGHGLLLFDEADALFGQRTQDVKGAIDRYANLEVNYLLQRVEAFEGITILTTNLDQGIDRALKRRLAAHIVFELPGDEERAALWKRLVTTGTAPLATDIDVEVLAREFPKMSGANIRNAALAAAFLAASAGASVIDQAMLVRAARAEYRSMGHVLVDRRH